MTGDAPEAARRAVATIFFVNGFVFASWVPYVPEVQMRLGLGPGVLGLSLLGTAAGGLLALPIAGWAITRIGSRRVVLTGLATFLPALALPVLAPSLAWLAAGLLLFGIGNGTMDVSMNAQGVAIEGLLARPIMSTLHGMFSVGGLAGAAVGGLALHAGVEPSHYVLGAIVVLGTIGGWAIRRLLPGVDATPRAERRAAWPTRALLTLGLLAALGLLAEGAMGDWSAVYLRRSLGAGPGLAAAGFACCSLAMAVGRLTGDGLVARHGSVRVMRASAALAAVGLGVALIVEQPAAAVFGFGCVGAGIANVIPILFGAAGRMPGVHPGHGIATVSTTGYCGFLAGPPLIGFVAEYVTLAGALGLVVLALLLISAGAGSVRVRA